MHIKLSPVHLSIQCLLQSLLLHLLRGYTANQHTPFVVWVDIGAEKLLNFLVPFALVEQLVHHDLLLRHGHLRLVVQLRDKTPVHVLLHDELVAGLRVHGELVFETHVAACALRCCHFLDCVLDLLYRRLDHV